MKEEFKNGKDYKRNGRTSYAGCKLIKKVTDFAESKK